MVAAQTSYTGSIPENAYNLELAADRLNGTLVAPGEQFSFNRAISPASLAAGFRWGYGVFDTGAGVETAPLVAGGICQVPTTLFQAVFRAGYPIDERHPHSYWIPRYGREGLDAAVDEETNLDFRFTNETPDHLLIQSWTQDEMLHVELFGTKPDWQTEILVSVIRGRVVATQRLVREPVAWLPVGETRQVEQAADGFTVTVSRIVTREGKPRQGSFTSRYKPARNVVLIGTGRRGG